MSREQIAERIKEVKGIMFYIDMKDRWSSSDFEEYGRYRAELIELKQMEKEMQQ